MLPNFSEQEYYMKTSSNFSFFIMRKNHFNIGFFVHVIGTFPFFAPVSMLISWF